MMKMGCVALLICALMKTSAQAQVFNTIFDFDGIDGASPAASLVQGRLGTFYGTTERGGDLGCKSGKRGHGCGTVFEITMEGQLTTLHQFAGYPTDGSFPGAGLVLGALDGNFYGTTLEGGAYDGGTVFKTTPTGKLTTLYSFCSQSGCPDGQAPSGLVQATDGNYYGTTTYGGQGKGTVFTVTPEGKLTTLHTFQGQDGDGPSALFLATNGNLYGTTTGGGAYGGGTVFQITRRGVLTTLYSFCAQPACADGFSPAGGVFQATGENFFGTTQYGGTSATYFCLNNSGCGTVFRLTPQGTFTTLYNFCSQTSCADGIFPVAPLIQATDGNLYGTTSYGGDLGCGGKGHGCGTIYSITPQGELTTVHTFDLPLSGQFGTAPSGLIQATTGNFYGTTTYGGQEGKGNGFGTLYSLSMGLGPFVSLEFDSGRVGQADGVLGQGFTGATGVSFNGTPAKFTVVYDTYLTATVPEGATTGYVTVTTPTGVLTSNVPFRVIQ